MSEIFPILTAPQSTGAPAHDAAATSAELSAFYAHCGRLAAVGAATPPNTVVVQPGGQKYSTISAAIAATTADEEVQATLYVGPGTYNEQVILKPYLHIVGSGIGQTIIAWTGNGYAYQKGTVVAASNASITSCTIQSRGNGWGTYATGLDCGGASPFASGNCAYEISDAGQTGINMIGIAVDFNGHNPGNSKLYLSYVTVTMSATADSTYPIALLGYGGAYVEAMTCKFVTQNTGPSGFAWGVSSALNSNLQLIDSYAEGKQWSLVINQSPSILVATKCVTNGPVGQGVVIKH